MVKVKKLFSLLAIVLLMLNNAVFAQYTDASYYEGRPIDKSREGIDYYREGDVIVYPGGMGSSENDMMERFRKGDIDEGKMREIAKEKFGEEFDEIEFEKGMLEMKERAKRKEAFSYEHSGFGESYYMSPSYEGYSKEHMIYGMVFEHIGDDIDPREIKQYCSEPDKVADIVIKKFKEKVGDLQSMCKRIDEQESKCLEYSKKGCSQLGTSIVRKDATDMEKLQAVAYSCPPDKDAIIEACRKRSMNYMEQRMENAADMCKKRFDFEGERLLRECRRFNEQQVCDKEKYIERCMGGAKKEDFEIDDGTAGLIALCAEGSFRDAQGILDQIISSGEKKVAEESARRFLSAPPRELTEKFITAVLEKKAESGLEAIQTAMEKNIDVKILYKMILRDLRSAILLKLALAMKKQIQDSYGENEFKFLDKLKDAAKPGELEMTLKIMLEYYETRSRSYLPQTPLELALLAIIGQNK